MKVVNLSPETKNLMIDYPQTDTRKLNQQNLKTTDCPSFACISGTIIDGHTFAHKVVAMGVKVLFMEEEKKDLKVIQIVVTSTRKALALAAKIFYDDPSSQFKLVGITGTNGKTSIVRIVEEILRMNGNKVASIGTLGYTINGEDFPLDRTTPDITELHEIFAQCLEAEIEMVIMEVSSHSLKLDRVYGLNFDIALFTNLSRDHLDFHENMRDYYLSKKILFDYLAISNGTAIINVDDKYGARIFKEQQGRKFSLTADQGDIVYSQIRTGFEESSLQLGFSNQLTGQLSGRERSEYPTLVKPQIVHTPLSGEHNLFNIAAGLTIAALIQRGTKWQDLVSALPGTIRGRMERVPNSFGINCYIDYAHTPSAIESACRSLKKVMSDNLSETDASKRYKQPRLITVFGAGGDRDRGKRPQMTIAAMQYSDLVIITSDNPRTENPHSIILDLVAELHPLSSYWIVVDRHEAICTAIKTATQKDTVLIAGKGHEQYQELKNGRVFFDDKSSAQNAFAEKSKESIPNRTEMEANGYSNPTVPLNIPYSLLQISLLLSDNTRIISDVTMKRWNRKEKIIQQDPQRTEKLCSDIDNINSVSLRYISTDTRNIKDFSLFVALRGANYDGNSFVSEALKYPNNFAVVSNDFAENEIDHKRLIKVDDTSVAYALLAKKYRSLFDSNVIAITGSTGKTSTKEYCSRIFSLNGLVLKNIANENNIIGVSRTLLSLSSHYRYVVLEIGSNHFGEIQLLADTAQPEVGIVTNIGPAHLEFFGNLEGVSQEKCSLLHRDLILRVIPNQAGYFSSIEKQSLKVGIFPTKNSEQTADYSFKIIDKLSGMIRFELGNSIYCLNTDVPMLASNAALAIVAAKEMGITKEVIQQALAEPLKLKNRMDIQKKGNRYIIADCYNANPSSMKAAIDYWLSFHPGFTHIAILGDMLELGHHTETYHIEIGDYLMNRTDQSETEAELISVGDQAKYYRSGRHFSCVEELLNSEVLAGIPTEAVVLIKASRALRLDKILERIIKQ